MTAEVKIKATADVDDAKRAFTILGQSLTDLNQGIELVGKATDFLKGVWDQSVGVALAYNEQVRDLSRLSGASADATSRLIQTADDLKVEYSTLTQAAKALAKDGLALTTEELARASDEYLKITDAGERAEFAVKRFGRAGLELTKILEAGGDELRSMAKAQQENLVLTEKQVLAARELEKSMDELEDSVTGVKVSIGNKLIPVLNEAYDASKKLWQITNNYNDILNDHNDEVIRSEKSYQGYVIEMRRAVELAGQLINKNGDLTNKYGIVMQANFLANEEKFREIRATEGVKSMMEKLIGIQGQVKGAYEAGAATAETASKRAAAAAKMVEDAQLKLLNNAMKPLTREIMFQVAAAGLDAEAQLILAEQMGMIDPASLSALRALQKLREKFDENRDGALDAKEGVREYIDEVRNFSEEWAKLQDKTITLTVREVHTGETYQGPSAPGAGRNQTGVGAPINPNIGVGTPNQPQTVINVNGYSGTPAQIAAEIARQLELEALLK